jgi:TorA maturation chaperone TorD
VNAVSSLVARSLCARWGARLFAYPDAALIAHIEQAEQWASLGEAVDVLGPSFQPCQTALAALREAFPPGREALAEEYTRLFARNVLCPPYASSYGIPGAFTRVEDLSELAGLYASFGYRVSLAHPDLQDHVSYLLEFLSVLQAKEAYAEERRWSPQARVCREARQRLCANHLGWLPRFVERLHAQARLPFYPAAGDWILAFLAAETGDARAA